MSTTQPPIPRPISPTLHTRQLLMNACTKLLAEKPLDAITVGDICARAAITRQTFYKYFKDKYALLDYSIRQMVQTSFDVRLPADAPFTRDNLILLIQIVCELIDFLHTYISAAHRAQLGTLLEQRVLDYTDTILLYWLTPDANENSAHDFDQAELQSTIAVWAIYGAAQKWETTEPREPAHNYALRVYPLLHSAIGSIQE